MDLHHILSTPSPGHVFDSAMSLSFPPQRFSSIQTDIERLITDTVAWAKCEAERHMSNCVHRTLDAAARDLARAGKTCVFETCGQYIVNALSITTHMCRALVSKELVLSEARKELERSSRETHLTDLSDVHQLDINVEKIRKISGMMEELLVVVVKVWNGEDEDIACPGPPMPASSADGKTITPKKTPVYVPNEQLGLKGYQALIPSKSEQFTSSEDTKPGQRNLLDADRNIGSTKRSFDETDHEDDLGHLSELRPRQNMRSGHAEQPSQDLSLKRSRSKRSSASRHNLTSRALQDRQADDSDDDGSDATDDERFAEIDLEALKHRGKGEYTCPKGMSCTKGGVTRDGKSIVVFDRNSAFSQHINKHMKPYRCGLSGCPNTEQKRRFARRDGLERHQKTVVHSVTTVEDLTLARAKLTGPTKNNPPKSDCGYIQGGSFLRNVDPES